MARKSKFSDEQIKGILAEVAAGKSVAEVAKAHGTAVSTIYNWKAQAAGAATKQTRAKERAEQRPKAKARATKSILNARVQEIASGVKDAVDAALREDNARLRKENQALRIALGEVYVCEYLSQIQAGPTANQPQPTVA